MDRQEAETQGVRDAATALPFLATILLMPPVILVFVAPLKIAGIPLIVFYLFSVWAAVIAAAFVVAQRLGRAERHAGQDDTPPEQSGPG
jgi:hypothetical protein